LPFLLERVLENPIQVSDPCHEALYLLARMLEGTQREHLALETEFLTRIDRLVENIGALREVIVLLAETQPLISPGKRTARIANGSPLAVSSRPREGRQSTVPSAMRPEVGESDSMPRNLETLAADDRPLDPQQIKTFVEQRLASFEQDRPGLWQKLVEVLMRP